MFKLLGIAALLLGLINQGFSPPEIWAEPVPFFQVQRDFLAPVSLYGPGHRGLDFVVKREQKVTAPMDGLITFSGAVVNRNVVTLRTTGGYLISFEQVCSARVAGEAVEQGQVLGQFCSISDGYEQHCDNCVHFSVRGGNGYLNPELFFGSLLPSILKS
jgi:murein DD-endopeptidase MepM/ murein hydrolase activator NlpD